MLSAASGLQHDGHRRSGVVCRAASRAGCFEKTVEYLDFVDVQVPGIVVKYLHHKTGCRVCDQFFQQNRVVIMLTAYAKFSGVTIVVGLIG